MKDEKPNETGRIPESDDARTTTAVFSAIVAIVLAAVYYGCRYGFRENSLLLVPQTLCLSFFLLFFSQGCQRICCVLSMNGEPSWVRSDAALSLFGLFALPLAGIFGSLAGVNLLPVMAGLGLLLFVTCFVRWFAAGPVRSLFFVIVAAIFGMWAAGAVWGSGFQNPLYEEALAGGYYLCKDVLVVSSMTSMLRTFGFPATGLDGLVYCWYHWGAYWFFSQLSEMLQVNALRFIQLGFPIIFIPFVLSRFLEFAVQAGQILSEAQSHRDLRVDAPFWLVVFAGWIGFVPTEVAAKMSFGQNQIFYSESYTVGMALSFIALSLSLGLYGRIKGSQGRLTAADHCLILFMPLVLSAAGLAKISSMFCLVVIYGYLFVRLGLWRHKTLTAALLVSGFALLALIKVTSRAGATGGYDYIYPLAYFISNIPFAWKPFFFLLYYFWSWVFIIQRSLANHLNTVSDVVQAMRDKTIVDVEVVVITCIVAGAPAYILPIGGGSGMFFMEFQWWLALGLILAHRTRLAEVFGFGPVILVAARTAPATMQLKHLCFLILTVCLVGSILANATNAVWRMAYQNLSIRNALVHPTEISEQPDALRERLYKGMVSGLKGRNLAALKAMAQKELLPLFGSVQESLEKARGYGIIGKLRELSELPVQEKRNALLFVPRSNKLYWEMVSSCDGVALVGPSITGMAMLDGLPDLACKSNLGHFDMYPSRKERRPPIETSEAALCEAARSRGFCRVIVLDSVAEGITDTRTIGCP